MNLETPTKITESESTLTHNEPGSSEPKSTQRDEGIERHLPPPDEFLSGAKVLSSPMTGMPPERLRLKVHMFAPPNSPVRLALVNTDVFAEGKTVPEAFQRLIEVARNYIESTGDKEKELLDYDDPYTWFRFVPPSQTAFVDNAALTHGLISELNRLYEYKGTLVESFLEENPSLAGLLFAAHAVIRRYFGSEVKSALEVVADPEALGDKQLFVLIRTEHPRNVARELLAELDKAWWLNELPRAEGKMEIALE